MFREADASIATVCRALLVLTSAGERVNFLAIHIHVVTVVADKGESIAEMANKEAPTRKSEVAQPNTRNAAHFTICRANVNRRILDGGGAAQVRQTERPLTAIYPLRDSEGQPYVMARPSWTKRAARKATFRSAARATAVIQLRRDSLAGCD
jgi:hypothetical protein